MANKDTVEYVKQRLEEWKRSAIDNCIAKGLLQIQSDQLTNKLIKAEGELQDIQIENTYLKHLVIEVNMMCSYLEDELDEIYSTYDLNPDDVEDDETEYEEDDYEGYEDEDQDDEPPY